MLQKHNDYWCWTVKQHLTKSDEDCSRLEICLLRRWNSMKTAHKFNTELSHKPGNDNPLPSADAVVNENSHAQSIRRRLCLLGCDDGCLSTYIHASSDDATAELASSFMVEVVHLRLPSLQRGESAERARSKTDTLRIEVRFPNGTFCIFFCFNIRCYK